MISRKNTVNYIQRVFAIVLIFLFLFCGCKKSAVNPYADEERTSTEEVSELQNDGEESDSGSDTEEADKEDSEGSDDTEESKDKSDTTTKGNTNSGTTKSNGTTKKSDSTTTTAGKSDTVTTTATNTGTTPTTKRPTTTTTTTTTTSTTKKQAAGVVLSIENEMLAAVNAEREKVGVAPLSLNASASKCAQIRAYELQEKMDHYRPDGTLFNTVLDANGVGYHTAGENIAAGQNSVATAVNAWMNSQSHREAMLNPEFTQIGTACVYVANDPAYYTFYWIQIFIG